MPAWQDKQPEPQRPVTLQDIFFWIQHVDEQVKRLSQVESATEKVYSQTRNKVDAMY